LVKQSNILITGANGQLGRSIKKNSKNYNYNFFYMPKDKLDISNYLALKKVIDKFKVDTIINCAAYTDVNKAETEKNKSDLINHKAVGFLAKYCSKNKIQLIHISTDYVFDGKKKIPYVESDKKNAVNYYGITKAKGENIFLKYKLKNSIIIRTSWLYSEYNYNFINQIIDKVTKNKSIEINIEQTGSLTNANDLANVILEIMPKIKNKEPEIFHFSNSGICNRFEIACKINKLLNGSSKVEYNFKSDGNVVRPKFSALDSNKICHRFSISNHNWMESLKNYLKNYKN